MNVKDICYLIGRDYVKNSFPSENSAFVKEAYNVIKKVNKVLFDLIPYKVVFTDNDTYSTAKEMREAILSTNTIYIYTGYSGHEYLNEEENAIGRAVHDVFAHCVCGCPFSFVGEYNAYLTQRQYYPEWVWNVLFAEIPAQTAAFYYKGSFTYNQRAIDAPQQWLDMCEPLKKDYSVNSILSVDILTLPMVHYKCNI